MVLPRPYFQAGLSLLETLVALSVVSLMAMTVIVMADFGRSEEEEYAAMIVRALGQARQEALVSGDVIGFGVDLDGKGYHFYRYKDRRWIIERNFPGFKAQRLPGGLRLERVDGAISRAQTKPTFVQSEPVRNAPQVWFDPTGFDTPFSFQLDNAFGPLFYIIRDDQGRLNLSTMTEPVL